MAGAMLTNSSFARKVQEEIHGREKSPSPSLTVYYRGQIKSTLGYLGTLLRGFSGGYLWEAYLAVRVR